jgi:hypothetical protein
MVGSRYTVAFALLVGLSSQAGSCNTKPPRTEHQESKAPSSAGGEAEHKPVEEVGSEHSTMQKCASPEDGLEPTVVHSVGKVFSSTLGQKQVYGAVRTIRGKLLKCFDPVLEENPEAFASVSYHLEISQKGGVTVLEEKTGVFANSCGDPIPPTAMKCLRENLETLSFANHVEEKAEAFILVELDWKEPGYTPQIGLPTTEGIDWDKKQVVWGTSLSEENSTGGESNNEVLITSDLVVDSALVKGASPKKHVMAVVKKNSTSILSCFKTEPGLEEMVTVQFYISSSGNVPVSQIASSTLSEKSAESCIAKRITTWKFDKPAGGGVAIVSLTLSFD